MLRNYFKIAIRSILRKRVFSLVNILGLSIGLASCMIISAYIISELNFDKFHDDADRTYRMIETVEGGELGRRSLANIPGAVGLSVAKNITSVEEYSRIIDLGITLNTRHQDKEFVEPFYCFDNNFFTFFDYPLVSGSPESVLSGPMLVVLSESAAKRYFGSENPIGKSIEALTIRGNYTLTVSGVMRDMPENSHLHFDMVLSHETPNTIFNGYMDSLDKDWFSNMFVTYFKLANGSDPVVVGEQMESLVLEKRPGQSNRTHNYRLQRLDKIHFQSENLEGDLNYREGNVDFIYIFLVVGLILLTTAFVNYINLSTVKATDRIKEIGLRKVMGASKPQLLYQFLSESLLFTLVSLIFAYTVVQLLRPVITNLFEADVLKYVHAPLYMGITIVLILSLGLIAGCFPAYTVLKGKTTTALKSKAVGLNRQTFFKGVIFFQFVISIGMVLSTIVVYSQLNYINNKDLGYNKESVALIEVVSNAARKNVDRIISGFKAIPGVQAVSASSKVPAEWKKYYEIEVTNEQGVTIPKIPFMAVDEGFLNVFDMELVSGRNLTAKSTDSLKVLINKTLADQLGIEIAEEQNLTLSGIKLGAQELGLQINPVYKVIGIIDDFHFQSLREKIPPMVFGFRRNALQNIDYFSVKLKGTNTSDTMLKLREVMKESDPNPFSYSFLDQRVVRYYQEDAKRSGLFITASFMAVFIAFIGLFALVHAAVKRRLKELGIRKVLGAGAKSLAYLLSSDFLRLLVLAALIASPLGYWGISNWLNDFAYRTEVSWWFFALTLLVCLFITALATASQIRKAISQNPADILRDE